MSRLPFIRRSLAGILLVALICCGLALPSAAAPASSAGFADVAEHHWAKAAIDRWSGRGIVQGDGVNFYPSRPITRAELMDLLVKALGYSPCTANPFADVSADDPYYRTLVAAWGQSLLRGNFTANGQRIARPSDSPTRAEAAVLFQRAFAIPTATGVDSRFPDALPAWAKGAIYGLEAAGYMHGRVGGRFDPTGILTRAEAVQILDNIVRVYLDQPGEYRRSVNGNVLVNVPGVVLSEMSINGNLYLTAGIGEGAFTLINVSVAGSTFVRGGGAGRVAVQNSQLGRLVLETALDLAALQSTQPPADNPGGSGTAGDKPSSSPAAGGSENDGGAGGSGHDSGTSTGDDPTAPSTPADTPGASISEY